MYLKFILFLIETPEDLIEAVVDVLELLCEKFVQLFTALL